MIFAVPQIPSYAQGFARSAAESAHCELWDGLVGLWAPLLGPAGLTLFDWSRLGDHGALTNMDSGSDWITSPRGYALNFDGSNDRVEVDKQYALSNSDAFTVVWSSRCLISSPTAEGVFSVYGTDGRLWAYHWDRDGINGMTVFYSSPLVKAGTDGSITQSDWHDYAATWDGTNLTLYLDGQAQTRVPGGVPTPPSTTKTEFGRGHDDFYGNLELSYAYFYNRRLTANEIIRFHRDPWAIIRPRRWTPSLLPPVGGPYRLTVGQTFHTGAVRDETFSTGTMIGECDGRSG